MPAKHLATLLLALGLCGIAPAAFADNDAGQEKDKSFIGKLDSFGKSLFGGILPADKSKPKDVATPKAEQRTAIQKPSAIAKPTVMKSSSREDVSLPDDEVEVPTVSSRQAGSVLTGSTVPPRARVDSSLAEDSDELMPENTPPAVPRSTDGTPKRVRRPLASTSLHDESETPESTETESMAAPPRKAMKESPKVTKEESEPVEDLADLPVTGKESKKAPGKQLHERMSMFRQSAFEPAVTRESRSHEDAAQAVAETQSVKPVKEVEASKPMERVMVAQRVRLPVHVAETPTNEPVPNSVANAPKELDATANAVERQPAPITSTPVVLDQSPAVAKTNDEGLLFTRKGPILSVETLGPRRISVGKESTYEVALANSGEVAAEDLVVYVTLPEWAEVVGAEVSTGDAQEKAGQPVGTVQWAVGHLDAKGRERLALRIVPRQNRPFDLAVRWESKPVGSQAMIEVQEPKLALQLEGPREVLYGKKEVYRLKLANTGNGAAENVAIMLMPVGGGENVPATHRLGSLAAGEEKVLDVELTARQAGNLTIQLDARADGGIHAELSEKVVVRRAGLKIDVEGPKMQFLGTAASYTVRVRNSGTAVARNINLSAILPAGTKYLSGIDDGKLDAASGKLDWTVASINPEVEQSFVLKCSLAAAGVCRVQVNATADDELSASGSTITRVESVANLSMEVRDPDGPVPVGDEATYEVRVRNRGTREAEGIEIFGYFSRGIEPTATEGSPSRLGPGQVVFQPIASLAPGAEVVLKVHAKAEAAGNHVFRAEAHCKPLGARLVREATNLYYADAPGTQQTAKQPATETPATDGMRTVTRPIQAETTIAPARK